MRVVEGTQQLLPEVMRWSELISGCDLLLTIVCLINHFYRVNIRDVQSTTEDEFVIYTYLVVNGGEGQDVAFRLRARPRVQPFAQWDARVQSEGHYNFPI